MSNNRREPESEDLPPDSPSLNRQASIEPISQGQQEPLPEKKQNAAAPPPPEKKQNAEAQPEFKSNADQKNAPSLFKPAPSVSNETPEVPRNVEFKKPGKSGSGGPSL